MTKYKLYYDKMLEENKAVFDQFREVHQNYTLDQGRWQEEFNNEGNRIVDIIRDYENRLCANTERGMYNKFSGGLSEKFWQLVRKGFPLIDNVGLIVSSPKNHTSTFKIKKISF